MYVERRNELVNLCQIYYIYDVTVYVYFLYFADAQISIKYQLIFISKIFRFKNITITLPLQNEHCKI